jgi:hypothetical protein
MDSNPTKRALFPMESLQQIDAEGFVYRGSIDIQLSRYKKSHSRGYFVGAEGFEPPTLPTIGRDALKEI